MNEARVITVSRTCSRKFMFSAPSRDMSHSTSNSTTAVGVVLEQPFTAISPFLLQWIWLLAHLDRKPIDPELVLSKLPIESHFSRIRLRVAPDLENVITTLGLLLQPQLENEFFGFYPPPLCNCSISIPFPTKRMI